MGFVEAIFRLTTVDERRRLGGHCFHYQSITKCFLAIHDAEFEPVSKVHIRIITSKYLCIIVCNQHRLIACIMCTSATYSQS